MDWRLGQAPGPTVWAAFKNGSETFYDPTPSCIFSKIAAGNEIHLVSIKVQSLCLIQHNAGKKVANHFLPPKLLQHNHARETNPVHTNKGFRQDHPAILKAT